MVLLVPTDVDTVPREVFVMSLRTIIAGVTVAAVAGMGAVHSGMEYLQVGFRQAGQALVEKIPTQIEIERLELLVEKVDKELSGARRVKVEANLNFDKAREQACELKAKLDRDLAQMTAIRNRLPGGCASGTENCSKPDIASLESALRSRMERYRQDQESLVRLEESVKRMEASVGALNQTFDKRRQERDTLAARLSVIRTDKAALELATGGIGTLPSSDTLTRGEKLAETLERTLKIENELARTEIDIVEAVVADKVNTINAAAEFDKLIGESSSDLVSK